MTREEAIKILGQYDVNFYWTSGEHEGEKIPANKLMDAFDMAIEALQQEPNEAHWIHFARDDECSRCGWSTGKYMDGTKYCPDCGAKMVR